MNRIGRDETVGYKIRLIHNRIHWHMETRRKQNSDDLTRMQRWTLGFLKDHIGQDVYQRDIEEAFSVSRATTSNMLSVMERKGLIERVSVEHDARLKKLVLTRRAEEMMERVDEDIRNMEARLTEGMTEEEVAVLKRYLDQMLHNLGEEPDGHTRCCGGKDK